MPRIYMPKVGQKVKLRLPEHYSQLDAGAQGFRDRQQKIYDECRVSLQRGLITEAQHDEVRKKASDEVHAEYLEYCKTHDVPCLWAWFEVLEVEQEKPGHVADVKLRHVARAVGAPEPAWEGWVSSRKIDPPIGWKPTYEIHCSTEEKAKQIIAEWFKRGIKVWVNHNMSSQNCGTAAYSPADSEGGAGWQYTDEPVEVIAPEDCPKLFTVLWWEYQDWADLRLPGMNKRDRAKTVAKLRAEGWLVEYDKHYREWTAGRTHVLYTPPVE